MPVVREDERPVELLDLGVAADEARQSPRGGSVEPGPLRARSGELVDLHRFRQALDRDRPASRHLDVALGELQRRGREQDRAGRRHLLHAGGQVCGLTDRRVVHPQIRPDGAHDHLAGVEPDADLDRYAVRAEDSLRVLRDRLLHPQRRVARPHRVILVRERRAEERHDPVAHHLVDGAFVAVHGLHHPFENGVEDLARFLRITVGEQLHRPLEVGEQHRDLLALAFEGGLRVEDASRRGASACSSRGKRTSPSLPLA